MVGSLCALGPSLCMSVICLRGNSSDHIALIDRDEGHAASEGKFPVSRRIADQHGLREIDVPLARSLDDHARARLSAIASVLFVYATEDIVDTRTQPKQFLLHIVVDARQFRRIDLAERNTTLIGHYNHQ